MTTITTTSLHETGTFARNNQNGPFKHQNPNPEKDQIFFSNNTSNSIKSKDTEFAKSRKNLKRAQKFRKQRPTCSTLIYMMLFTQHGPLHTITRIDIPPQVKLVLI